MVTGAPSFKVRPVLATDPPSNSDYDKVKGDRRPSSEVRSLLACVRRYGHGVQGLWRGC
ncbi:hypothetical protein V6Z11_A07G075000 [Gossypium hirsutum]